MRPIDIDVEILERDKLRFLKFVGERNENGCMIWKSSAKSNGYGKFWLDGKSRCANRIAYRIAKGDIPADLIVMHKCDTPACVNPEHLDVGTYKDNIKDSQLKNRRAILGDHGRSILDLNDVLAIREAYKNGEKQQEIANRFSITQCHVSKIVLRQSWQT